MASKRSSLVLVFSLFLLTYGCEPNVNSRPELEFWFNYPQTDPTQPGEVIKLDFITEDKLVQLINQAAFGSDIHIAIYLITRMEVPLALERAIRERQVNVFVIVEDGWPTVTTKQKEIVAYLDGLASGSGETQIEVIRCNRGCNGSVINHNKFFLFSEAGDWKHIVVQSAANLNDATGRLFENSVVIRGDRKVYEGYLEYWNDMAELKKDRDYFHSVEGEGFPAEGTVKVHFFPQEAGDQLLDILSNVECGIISTTVKATASNWDTDRGIVSSLKELGRKGCEVSAIVPDNKLKTACDVRIQMYPEVEVFTAAKLPHSKYIIIEGAYKGGARSFVVAGSQNFSIPSLRSTDDTLLEIIDEGAVAAFSENWEMLLKHGVKDEFLDVDEGIDNSCMTEYLKTNEKH